MLLLKWALHSLLRIPFTARAPVRAMHSEALCCDMIGGICQSVPLSHSYIAIRCVACCAVMCAVLAPCNSGVPTCST